MRLEPCDKSDSGNNTFTVSELTFMDEDILTAYRKKSGIVVSNYHESQKVTMELRALRSW